MNEYDKGYAAGVEASAREATDHADSFRVERDGFGAKVCDHVAFTIRARLLPVEPKPEAASEIDCGDCEKRTKARTRGHRTTCAVCGWYDAMPEVASRILDVANPASTASEALGLESMRWSIERDIKEARREHPHDDDPVVLVFSSWLRDLLTLATPPHAADEALAAMTKERNAAEADALRLREALDSIANPESLSVDNPRYTARLALADSPNAAEAESERVFLVVMRAIRESLAAQGLTLVRAAVMTDEQRAAVAEWQALEDRDTIYNIISSYGGAPRTAVLRLLRAFSPMEPRT